MEAPGIPPYLALIFCEVPLHILFLSLVALSLLVTTFYLLCLLFSPFAKPGEIRFMGINEVHDTLIGARLPQEAVARRPCHHAFQSTLPELISTDLG
jgi:hypothetical protein